MIFNMKLNKFVVSLNFQVGNAEWTFFNLKIYVYPTKKKKNTIKPAFLYISHILIS